MVKYNSKSLDKIFSALSDPTRRAIVEKLAQRESTVSQRAEPRPIITLAPSTNRPKPKLLDQVRLAIRARHYSRRTEEAYVAWIKRFIFFHNKRHPVEMGEPESNAFLTHLAVKERVSASTQNQALSALLFLYRHVLGRELGDFGEVIRARKPTRLPVVMTREEVKAVLAQLTGDKWLMASLMYGAGLRLMECFRLRVKDIDFGRNEILVRDGKGAKDRVTMLPETLKTPLQDHPRKVQTIHVKDLRNGWGRVQMPDALDRKYPSAAADWRWQWVFPQENRWKNNKTGEQGRHHVHEPIMQKAVGKAARDAGLTKRATCHTFRHSFATHLPREILCIRFTEYKEKGILSHGVNLRMAMTSERCKNFLGTKTYGQRWLTRMC